MSLELSAYVEQRDVDVSLAVGSGETVALLGANGAGKSTVLAVAAGLLRPDRGRVVLSGRTLVDGARFVPPHRRRVALLAQQPLLFPHLTVLDNVAFGPRSAGASRRGSRSVAGEWLARVGVTDLAGRRPAELSGGQAQRVAVARALAAEPELLLLDEPLAALDVDVAPELRRTLRSVLADRTAVVVTHDPLDALLLADRAVVLESGRVVEEGPASDVLVRPRSDFAARMAGLNMLVGTWSGERVELASGQAVQGLVVGPAPDVGARAVATFRPSAVAVYRRESAGSPRNVFHDVVRGVEPLADLVRVRTDSIRADVTAASVAELDLAPGVAVTLSVKATEVSVYRA